MSTLRDLHAQAMQFAADAEIRRRHGDEYAARQLFQAAFERERDAARLIASKDSIEPTRSVLLRSAASLAIDCGELREAERLIATALAGDPPQEIAEELRDLYETCNFKRHLELKGTQLVPGDIQISLAGSAVGLGIVSGDECLPRIQTVESMLLRTAERQNGLKFRERGRPPKSITESYSLYLSTPRAASFAITLRVGGKYRQKQLFSEATDTVLEFLDCISLYTEERRRELQERIGNSIYYRNFISQARRLSPDGKRITTVGFTCSYGEKQREVALLGPPSDNWYVKSKGERRIVTFSGTLVTAHKDERKPGRNLIGVRDENGITKTVLVPRGLMNDIVRPLWDRKVVVRCSQEADRLLLVSCDPVGDENV